ncbi:hypothetical protein ACTA71_000313 [Dictyostelium dimigraforme]
MVSLTIDITAKRAMVSLTIEDTERAMVSLAPEKLTRYGLEKLGNKKKMNIKSETEEGYYNVLNSAAYKVEMKNYRNAFSLSIKCIETMKDDLDNLFNWFKRSRKKLDNHSKIFFTSYIQSFDLIGAFVVNTISSLLWS